jgi:hypothetical protein
MDPCRIDVGREPMLHAETAAAHREDSHRSLVETRATQKKSQTAWIADSDWVINDAAGTVRVTNSIRKKRDTPRERWGWTRLKLRMQTHGFLGGNKCKTSDNVVDGKVKVKGEVVVKRGMEGTMVTRSAYYEENFPFKFKLSLLG